MNAKMPAEPPFMEAFRNLVKGDGLDLELIKIEPLTGTLHVRLFAGPNLCTECVMSAAFLEEIALPVVRKSNASIRRVVIQDDRAISL